MAYDPTTEGGRGQCPALAGESFSTATAAGPQGEAGAEVSVLCVTGATSVARATDRRRELTDHHHFFQPLPEMSKRIKRQTRGWGNYFKLGDPAQAFRLLNHYLTERLMQHLERRSQRAMKRPATESYPSSFKRLGLKLLGAA